MSVQEGDTAPDFEMPATGERRTVSLLGAEGQSRSFCISIRRLTRQAAPKKPARFRKRCRN